jgi:hypothetical protein
LWPILRTIRPRTALFTCDSPGFITTDTVVPVADLAYFAPPPLNFISSVEFIPASSDPAHLGLPELDVFQYSGPRPVLHWQPVSLVSARTFTQYGVTPASAQPGFPNSQSFGFPNSQLVVAAPEPTTIGLCAGLFGLLALRRRSAK